MDAPRDNCLIKLDTPTAVYEIGYVLEIETSREGEITRIHWEKIERAEHRLTETDEKD